MNTEPKEASLLLQYKVLKRDLDELLDASSHRRQNQNLDYYQRCSILRDGVEVISKRCAHVIELIEQES